MLRRSSGWTFQPEGAAGKPIVHAGPVMRSPYVYVAVNAGDKRLYALDLATGKPRWATKLGTQGVLAADRDAVLLRSWGRLWRYVPRSGHPRLAAAGVGRVVVVGVAGERGPGERHLLVLARGRVRRRLRRADGPAELAARVRLLQLRSRRSRRARPRRGVADNSEPDPGARGSLSALDGRTGHTLWSGRTAGAYQTGASPVVAGGRVFVRTTSGPEGRPEFSIEAFRASDGKQLWHAAVGSATGYWFTLPAADATLVVHPSEDGFLYALDAATGALRWRAKLGFSGSTPAIANALVWIGDDAGHLVALDARTGRELWRSSPFTLGDLAKGTPAQTGTVNSVVAGGYVLVATTEDGLTRLSRARSLSTTRR